jgi:hypothetical protein
VTRVIVKVVLLALGLGCPLYAIMSAAAQSNPRDVAYVEGVRGRVFGASEGKPTLLDPLDMVSERTQLDLRANSELRICHYVTRTLLTLRGPLHAVVSASGVTAENGAMIKAPVESCATPLVSIFQGGLIARATGAPSTNVPLQANIRVTNRGTQAIRRIALWDIQRQIPVINFNGNAARPTLHDGESYRLTVELGDGREFELILWADAAIAPVPLIVIVR